MVIYTTYFANLKNLPEGIVPVSISQVVPAGYKGLVYKQLAPPTSILNAYKRNHDENTYIMKYTEQVLSQLNQFKVMKDLEKLTGGAEAIALVCYEKSDDFCHRHIAARWLRKAGIDIKEFA
jgi:uncharacterized protein YeaO (DUF488 family)